MRIRLIGGFAAFRGEVEISKFPTSRSRLLLAYLAYHRNASHSRELLAEILWPGGNPDVIRLRLNQTVSELKRTVGDGFIVSDRFSIRLAPAVETDLHPLMESVRSARSPSLDRKDRLALELQAVDGELLAGFYDDWVLDARATYSEAIEGALLDVAQSSAPSEAVAFARRAVAQNRYSEAANEALLKSLLASGRKLEAVEHYRRFESMLREEFAVDVPAEIASLMSDTSVEPSEPATKTRKEVSARAKSRTDSRSEATVEHILETYIGLGDAARALHLAADLIGYWNHVGELSSGYRWIRTALALREAMFASADAKARALIGLAAAAMGLGRLDEARAALEGAMALANKSEDQHLVAVCLRTLGRLASRQGKHVEARHLMQRSADLCRRIGDKSGLSDALTGVGESLRFQGDLGGAEVAHREARRLRMEIGRQDRLAESALNLGILASRQGCFEEASKWLQSSLETSRTWGSRPVIADGLMEMAGVAAESGRPALAASLLSAMARLREEIKAPLPLADRDDYLRFLRAARRGLDRDEFKREWDAGRKLDLHAAIDLALCGS